MMHSPLLLRRNACKLLLAVTWICISASNSEVIELTSETFEHQTQASTGQTTGKWFVKFFAPWCGHCKSLEPVWEDASVQLQEQDRYSNAGIVMARVDCTSSTEVCNRFGVQGYPTLLLFAGGRKYTYKGPRGVDDLLEFAFDGYQALEGDDIPGPPSWLETFLESNKLLGDLKHDLDHIVALRKNAAVLLVVLGVIWGVLLSSFVGMLFGSKKAATSKAKKE